MTPSDSPGLVYDAPTVSRILGLPVECSDPAPAPSDDEIVLYFGGWTLATLHNSPAGKQHIRQQDLNGTDGWTAEAGYYRLLLPVPGTNREIWSEQIRHLATSGTASQVAPICIAATVLLVHLTETGSDLLSGHWCRCAESLPDGRRVTLGVDGGSVRVGSGWDDRRHDRMWLAGCRKC